MAHTGVRMLLLFLGCIVLLAITINIPISLPLSEFLWICGTIWLCVAEWRKGKFRPVRRLIIGVLGAVMIFPAAILVGVLSSDERENMRDAGMLLGESAVCDISQQKKLLEYWHPEFVKVFGAKEGESELRAALEQGIEKAKRHQPECSVIAKVLQNSKARRQLIEESEESIRRHKAETKK